MLSPIAGPGRADDAVEDSLNGRDALDHLDNDDARLFQP